MGGPAQGIGAGQAHLQGRFGFHAVGRQKCRPAVFRIVLRAERIHENRHATAPRQPDDRPGHARRENAFVVVAQHDGICSDKVPLNFDDQSVLGLAREWPRVLPVHTQHLLRDAVLGPAHEARLNRRRPAGQAEHAAGFRAGGLQVLGHLSAVLIAADHAEDGDVGPQGAEVADD